LQKFSKFYPIHGDLSQSEREYALAKFKQPGSGCILVGTDVAARGLDIDDVDVVIQCGCSHVDSFVHRAGRTARRGKSGTNILFLDAAELKFAMELE
jgi:superfamily II DNA/RNA helicase